jgi:hypothetical protein
MMEVLVSTASASAPLSFGRVHRRRPPASVAVGVPARGWRCRCAAPTAPDPAPSEEPASATTVVVADKPAEEPEAGTVSDGSDGAVEATVVDAPVSSPSEESAGVDDILSKVMPRRLPVRCYAFQSKRLLVYRIGRIWGLASIVRPN